MRSDFKDYVIAEHRMRIKGDTLQCIVNHIQGFEPFFTSTPGVPLFTLTGLEDDDTEAPIMRVAEYTFEFEGIISVFGTCEEGYLFEMRPNGGEPLVLWGKEGTLYIKGHMNEGDMTIRLTRFALWIAFGMSTVHLQTIAIHTSTITYQGHNVLFLGESGTGKSTHTKLWRTHIKGSTLLNDDSPILRIIDGKAWVFGSPWSGKTPCYKNEKYPLAACVRLSQAPYNRIRKLNILQAYAAIHPSCPPEFAYDEHLYDGISQTLDSLLSQVPFYHLECLPDEAAARLSYSTVFGED